MTKSVDLNADMGESFGPWPMGSDADLLQIISSANIACGFHAGDPDTMAHTMCRAVDNGVGIAAHGPGAKAFAHIGVQIDGSRHCHAPSGSSSRPAVMPEISW